MSNVDTVRYVLGKARRPLTIEDIAARAELRYEQVRTSICQLYNKGQIRSDRVEGHHKHRLYTLQVNGVRRGEEPSIPMFGAALGVTFWLEQFWPIPQYGRGFLFVHDN